MVDIMECNLKMMQENNKQLSLVIEKIEKLLGNLKKYVLHPTEDWGELYIRGTNIRIDYQHDNENDLLFTITKFGDEITRFENITGKEVKLKLFEIYGY